MVMAQDSLEEVNAIISLVTKLMMSAEGVIELDDRERMGLGLLFYRQQDLLSQLNLAVPDVPQSVASE